MASKGSFAAQLQLMKKRKAGAAPALPRTTASSAQGGLKASESSDYMAFEIRPDLDPTGEETGLKMRRGHGGSKKKKVQKVEPTKKLKERMFDCVSDGLSRPVDSQSKGALMLAKMSGAASLAPPSASAAAAGGSSQSTTPGGEALPPRPPVGLGRSEQGRAEPIPIHLEGGFIGGPIVFSHRF